MKCPFCKTRISKNSDLCPNCGQRIEGIDSNNKTNTLSIDIVKKFCLGFVIVFCLFLGIVMRPSFRYHMNDVSGGRIDLEVDKIITIEDALKYQKGLLDEEVINTMVDWRNDLRDILIQTDYKNFKVEDEVRFDGFLHNSTMIVVTASLENYDIKISCSHNRYKGTIKSYAIAGTGETINRQFEIKEDDVKKLFDYLGFDNAYQVLSDGYKQMKKVEDNKYQYIKYDDYNVTLSNDIYNSIYKYSYIISR